MDNEERKENSPQPKDAPVSDEKQENQKLNKENDEGSKPKQTRRLFILGSVAIAYLVLGLVFILTISKNPGRIMLAIDGIIAFFFILSVIIIIAAYQKSFRLRPTDRIVIENVFTGSKRVAGPGLCLITPIFEKRRLILSIAEKTFDIDPVENVVFSDGLVAESIDSSITLQIGKTIQNTTGDEEQIRRAVIEYTYKYTDLSLFLEQIIRTEILRIAGEKPLTSLTQKPDAESFTKGFIEDQDNAENKIREAIEGKVAFDKGTKITNFAITSIKLDEKAKDVMDNLAQAKTKADMMREEAGGTSDATRLRAEGESQAILTKAEAVISAAKVISENKDIPILEAAKIVMLSMKYDKEKEVAKTVERLTLVTYEGQAGNMPMPRLEIGADSQTKDNDKKDDLEI